MTTLSQRMGPPLAGVALLVAASLLAAGCPAQTQWLVVQDGDASTDPSQDAATTCDGILVLCINECVDLSANPQHCGGCDRECSPGQECVSGNCRCPEGTDVCDGNCRDTATDPLHCGSCNHPCDPTEMCALGQCICRPGFVRCSGEGECVDTTLDPSHCGFCGNDCSQTSAPFCANGSCTAVACEDRVPASVTCDAEEASCVSPAALLTSVLHCGACNNHCETNEICNAGHCQSYYPAVGCDSCPCADVCGTNLCCTLPGVAAPACLVGASSCP